MQLDHWFALTSASVGPHRTLWYISIDENASWKVLKLIQCDIVQLNTNIKGNSKLCTSWVLCYSHRGWKMSFCLREILSATYQQWNRVTNHNWSKCRTKPEPHSAGKSNLSYHMGRISVELFLVCSWKCKILRFIISQMQMTSLWLEQDCVSSSARRSRKHQGSAWYASLESKRIKLSLENGRI